LKALRVFISYSHKDDENGFQKLVTHLRPMVREGLIEPWHDRRITAGTEWAGQIDEHLFGAQIVVLLVSPDFLASDYCNDVEMTQAMELREAQRARVVPVILRPCDWHTSRFAKLKVLPQDGKPVIKWVPEEDGFVDVIRGLRGVVRELQGREKESHVQGREREIESRRQWTKVSHRSLSFAIVAVLLLFAVFVWWRQQAALTAQGDAALNTSRYDLAAKSYDDALRLNPFSSRARIGAGIVRLSQRKYNGDFEAFNKELQALRADAPANPYLEILEGEFLRQNDRDGRGHDEAMPHYEKAAALKPDFADAYFYQGVVLQYRGDDTGALAKFEEAARLEPATPRYRLNIAALKFRHGKYPDAQKEYQTIAKQNLPLADRNLSEVDRLLGQMADAKTDGLKAVNLLERSETANSPQNSGAWSFEVKGDRVVLNAQIHKLCYARLSLSATLFLLGENAESAKLAAAANQACTTDWRSLSDVLEQELDLLKTYRPDTQKEVDQYINNLRMVYR